MDELLQTLEDIANLPESWDSYGAPPIDPQCLATARELISGMGIFCPHAIVPTAAGGVQLEWHGNNVDIEAELTPSEKVKIFYSDENTGTEEECEFSIDPTTMPMG